MFGTLFTYTKGINKLMVFSNETKKKNIMVSFLSTNPSRLTRKRVKTIKPNVNPIPTNILVTLFSCSSPGMSGFFRAKTNNEARKTSVNGITACPVPRVLKKNFTSLFDFIVIKLNITKAPLNQSSHGIKMDLRAWLKSVQNPPSPGYK